MKTKIVAVALLPVSFDLPGVKVGELSEVILEISDGGFNEI